MIESCLVALKVDPSLTEAKSRLAEVLEITGRLQEALDLINEGKVAFCLSVFSHLTIVCSARSSSRSIYRTSGR